MHVLVQYWPYSQKGVLKTSHWFVLKNKEDIPVFPVYVLDFLVELVFGLLHHVVVLVTFFLGYPHKVVIL